MGQQRSSTVAPHASLKILLALASRHFGMTLEEMAEEAHVEKHSVYYSIRTLRSCGVEIITQREPDNRGWHLIYRLKRVAGKELRRPAVDE